MKCVAKEFGINAEITSPTYVIMKIYDINGKTVAEKFFGNNNNKGAGCSWKHLVHIDAYRLEKPEELQALDWESLVADKENLILVEWPENVGLVENDGQKILSQRISFRIEGERREIELI